MKELKHYRGRHRAAIRLSVISLSICIIFSFTSCKSENTVDLMKYVKISYNNDGLSGMYNSIVTVNFNWPSEYEDNQQISNFLNTVEFSFKAPSIYDYDGNQNPEPVSANSHAMKGYRITEGENLSVVATYDAQIAKDDNIHIANGTSKSIKIFGLKAVATLDQITKSLAIQCKDEPIKQISTENSLRSSILDSQDISAWTLDSIYKGKNQGDIQNSAYIFYIYKSPSGGYYGIKTYPILQNSKLVSYADLLPEDFLNGNPSNMLSRLSQCTLIAQY